MWQCRICLSSKCDISGWNLTVTAFHFLITATDPHVRERQDRILARLTLICSCSKTTDLGCARGSARRSVGSPIDLGKKRRLTFPSQWMVTEPRCAPFGSCASNVDSLDRPIFQCWSEIRHSLPRPPLSSGSGIFWDNVLEWFMSLYEPTDSRRRNAHKNIAFAKLLPAFPGGACPRTSLAYECLHVCYKPPTSERASQNKKSKPFKRTRRCGAKLTVLGPVPQSPISLIPD